jgi:hypothetical protein
MMVHRSLGRRLYGGTSAIRRRIRLVNPEYGGGWRTVVGVVDDVRYSGVDDPGEAALYTPFAQTPFLWSYVTVRSAGPPMALGAAVREALRSVDPTLDAAAVKPISEVVARPWLSPGSSSSLPAPACCPPGAQPASSRWAALNNQGVRRSRRADREAARDRVHEHLHPRGRDLELRAIYVRLRICPIARSPTWRSRRTSGSSIRRPNLRARMMIPSALGGGENFFAIHAVVLGPEFLRTAEVAKAAADRMRTVKGLTDVDPGVSLNSPELQVRVDRQRASDLGVRAADVATAVRLMIAGEDEAGPRAAARRALQPSVPGPAQTPQHAGFPARLRRRRHRPGDPASRPPRRLRLPVPGLRRAARRDHAQPDHRVPARLIFMYMVLAAQFDSFLHPLAIMLSLPLSIPFALLTLLLTGRKLNLWSALGVLLLFGIVKKNGILQVDYTNKLLAEGVPLRQAILQANHVRLRPILSIVAGLIPTAIGIGAGSAQRSAVAVIIIGGQTLCLLLTLVVTPVAYSLLAEAREHGFRTAVAPMVERLRLRAARLRRA